MGFDSVVGYTFTADTYCPACIVAKMTPQGFNTVSAWDAEQTLTALALAAGIDRLDEHSYDSSEFPKVILSINVHSGDEPDYCGRCHQLLAPYECSICGDEHGESAHGEPLVMRETGQRTITDAVLVNLSDAGALLEDSGTTTRALFQLRLWGLRRAWERITDDERDEFAPEYLDDIDSILSDAGYLPITNADQGTWAVYAPTVSDVESAVGSG